ncbi:MAG: hypothetical protein KatS3mg076_1539 [Candidatus Binatia bacterium]|nr:MAG: hypothetical protein KatS3mg076_1539 [Candidatus Binatia bacterium]
MKGVVAAVLNRPAKVLIRLRYASNVIAKRRIFLLELPDAPVQFAASESTDKNVVAPVELVAIRFDLVPRRVTEDGVETGVVAVHEDLGKLELPVEEVLALADLLEVGPPRLALGVSLQGRRVVDRACEALPFFPDLRDEGGSGAEVEEQLRTCQNFFGLSP